MQDTKQRQAGGIVVFLVVGLVLVTALGGAIYVSKQQGRTASKADTVAIDDSGTVETPDNAVPQADTTKPEITEDETNVPTAPAPTESTPVAPQPTTPTPGSGSGAAVPTTGPSHIATTGPTDTIIPVFGMASLAAGLVAYRRSHMAVRATALKQ